MFVLHILARDWYMFESATDIQIHMTCYTYSMYPMKSNLHQLIREVLSGQITLVTKKRYSTTRNWNKMLMKMRRVGGLVWLNKCSSIVSFRPPWHCGTYFSVHFCQNFIITWWKVSWRVFYLSSFSNCRNFLEKNIENVKLQTRLYTLI